MSSTRRMLLVSPCPHTPEFGGVQISARLAWQAVSNGGFAENARLLCYGPDCGRRVCGGLQWCAQSKLSLACGAFRAGSRAELILFWHVGMLKLLRLLGPGAARVALFLHGIECWRDFSPSTRRLFGRVHLFLTNSRTTWERFLEKNPEWRGAPHRTIGLGIGEGGIEAGPPGCPPAALMVGRIDRREDYKGHKELIRAWPRVLEDVPEAELWIAGDGDLKQELAAMAASSGLADRVRFFGAISEQKKEELIRRCRCLALPSRGEGFGLVYLEAMRLGRPCLVSTLDAGREVVNPPEAGLAVNPNDRGTLAEALLRLLATGEEWQAWSTAARQRYEARFTAAHFQKRLMSALGMGLA